MVEVIDLTTKDTENHEKKQIHREDAPRTGKRRGRERTQRKNYNIGEKKKTNVKAQC